MKNVVDLISEWKTEQKEGGIRYTYPAPEGAKKRPLGFDIVNEAAVDVMGWYGFRLSLNTKGHNVHITAEAGFADGRRLRREFTLAEPGEHLCDMSLESFDIEMVKSNVWRELKSLEVIGDARIMDAKILRGSSIAIETGVLGKSGKVGETVRYTVTVHNCLGTNQWVSASQAAEGWESMGARIVPEKFLLEPYGNCQVEVSVQVHEYMPAGAHEKTILCFLPEGNSAGAAQVSFYTLSALEHPYIYHTKDGWGEVAKKIQREAIFGPGYEKLRRDAEDWDVPPMVPFGERDYCYDTFQENYLMACAYLYSITKEVKYAEKIAAFFRFFTEPDTGYPMRKKGCSQSYVQEGHFFQHLALAYDMIYDAGVLEPEEHEGIENCFRIYMGILDRHICSGHISNWTLSELTGAVYCAMVLQDFERVERFCFGPCGSFEQLRHGAFADGWWFECSVGYNIWVASMFLHTAHALLPFGINLIHYHFPLSYGKQVDSMNIAQVGEAESERADTGLEGRGSGRAVTGSEGKGSERADTDSESRGSKRANADTEGYGLRGIRHGMYNEKWGGIKKSYIRIKDLFDAVVPFLDERGVLFGINDSDEKKIEGVHFGSTFDLAYTYYRDPAYIPVIRNFEMADPVFGHGSFPEEAGSVPQAQKGMGAYVSGSAIKDVPADKKTRNAYADNIGIACLRSRTEGRAGREQIQAVLRYGSHGFAHGHFDRTELLSVMRYGRSFFNPEHVWWGYGHFMYKFYVQNSNTKNMAVVDGKMQVPADARRVLFYSGERMQAAGVRTVSRWGFPPFGGMIYREGESLKERCAYNASDLPSYDAAPYGEITELTEPIAQTRIMAVLDDCLVLFDSLVGQEEHRYESLMQIKGFLKLEGVGGGNVLFAGHTGKKSEDPRSDEQFITDCLWYTADGETVAKFETIYGEGEDLRGTRSRYNEPGSLCMDVYTAWPKENRQCVGLAAEDLGQKSPYDMKVWDGEDCAASFGANPWLLGARKLDVRLNPDSNRLKLEIHCKPLFNEQMYPHDSKQCLFLGGAYVELEDGSRMPLTELTVRQHNIDGVMGIGKDYQGGRVLIEGIEYPDAIPISPVDHGRQGVLEYDLSQVRAVRLGGIIGVDNFPGEEAQRRRTYGVAQKAVKGRFITVIEPHEGAGKIAFVEGISENRVGIRYRNGSRQEVAVEEIDGAPKVVLHTFPEAGIGGEERGEGNG